MLSVAAMTFCKLLTVLVLIHNTGGLWGAQVKTSIIGGQNAPKHKWPWMVHLNLTTDGKYKWRCGGSLLNTEYVLTAASCWKRDPMPNEHRSMAFIGSHDLHKGSPFYKGIMYGIIHDDFRAVGTGYENNIALLRLKSPVSYSEKVAPVTLPSPSSTFTASDECWITGWGYTRNGVPLGGPETLQQLRIPIVPWSECKVVYPDLKSAMLCAGAKSGGKDACEGDYGGPLVCRVGDGFVQAGIISYGSAGGCGLPGKPGVYTEVAKYLNFINREHHSMEASAEV